MTRTSTVALATAVLILIAILARVALAGPLSPTTPTVEPTHHTLTEIYDAIEANTHVHNGANELVAEWLAVGDVNTTPSLVIENRIPAGMSGVVHAVIVTNTNTTGIGLLDVYDGPGAPALGVFGTEEGAGTVKHVINMRFDDGLAILRRNNQTAYTILYKLDSP
ncbi:MAG: hypothetical protein ACF8GE_01570 [Phycisphaerales bacterium JB043]